MRHAGGASVKIVLREDSSLAAGMVFSVVSQPRLMFRFLPAHLQENRCQDLFSDYA